MAPALSLSCLRLCPLSRSSPSAARRWFSPTRRASDRSWPQATPLGAYYESILRHPIAYSPRQDPGSRRPSPGEGEDQPPSGDQDPDAAPTRRRAKRKPGRKPAASAAVDASPPAPSSGSSGAAAEPLTAQERARIVFGSRLLGPAEDADRLANKRARSSYIAGVLVPPRPEEPDNCCMSGCVNCVWDRYREEAEEWSAKTQLAQQRLRRGDDDMDADGGGGWESHLGSGKIAKDMWDEGVFSDLPVGIREFMKQEKRLREKHQRQGTTGG